jgi:hypothetical protein
MIRQARRHKERKLRKIEGVAWNYKNEWSIETQVAFSSKGFSRFAHSI